MFVSLSSCYATYKRFSLSIIDCRKNHRLIDQSINWEQPKSQRIKTYVIHNYVIHILSSLTYGSLPMLLRSIIFNTETNMSAPFSLFPISFQTEPEESLGCVENVQHNSTIEAQLLGLFPLHSISYTLKLTRRKRGPSLKC